MARKKKGIPVKIRGGAAEAYGVPGHTNPKFGRKEAKLNRKSRKNRKIGSGRR